MFVVLDKGNGNESMDGEPIKEMAIELSPDRECVISMRTEHMEVRQRIGEKDKLIEIRNDINKVLRGMKN